MVSDELRTESGSIDFDLLLGAHSTASGSAGAFPSRGQVEMALRDLEKTKKDQANKFGALVKSLNARPVNCAYN